MAKLARLGLTETEIKKFQKELSSVLDYFNSLKEVDVSNIEPTFHPAEHSFGVTQERQLETTRTDKAEPQTIEVRKKLIKAAPEEKNGYIKVKAIFQ